MQPHARVCEENKLEELEKILPIETILRLQVQDIGRLERRIKTMFSWVIHHSIKVLVICKVKHY